MWLPKSREYKLNSWIGEEIKWNRRLHVEFGNGMSGFSNIYILKINFRLSWKLSWFYFDSGVTSALDFCRIHIALILILNELILSMVHNVMHGILSNIDNHQSECLLKCLVIDESRIQHQNYKHHPCIQTGLFLPFGAKTNFESSSKMKNMRKKCQYHSSWGRENTATFLRLKFDLFSL